MAATLPGSRMVLPQTLPTEDQLKARRQLAEARRSFRSRKTDTRRKIVVGAVVLAQADRDPAFRAVLQLILQQHVTRPIDRALLTALLDGPACPSATMSGAVAAVDPKAKL